MSLAIPKSLPLAIIAIESGGDDNAVGDFGRSVGCMQISESRVEEINAIPDAPRIYELDDRYRRSCSIEMLKAYVEHHCTRDKLGRSPTIQDAVMAWHGGKPDDAMEYWELVKGAMP